MMLRTILFKFSLLILFAFSSVDGICQVDFSPNLFTGYQRVGLQLKPDDLIFVKYKKPQRKFKADTATTYSFTIYNKNLEMPGYLWGKLKGADRNNFYIETDQIYNNCYFDNIYYSQTGSDKYLAAVKRNYLLEIAIPPKHRQVNTFSETLSWIAASTVLFSPAVCIDYRKGEFLQDRYFKINRIALPVLAVCISVYFLTDFRTVRVSETINPEFKKLYYLVE